MEERKQLYANNVPRALPDGLDNITINVIPYSSTTSPGERNRVTISGIAPPEAYTFVFRSIKFQNNGPLITNVRRRIVFRVWDDLDAKIDVPNPDEAMVSTRIMNLVNVNDPPVAARLQTTLTLSTPGATGIGQMIAYDLDSPTIWFNITCLPGKGNVTITDVNTGEYSYTHDPDKPGTDTFVFRVGWRALVQVCHRHRSHRERRGVPGGHGSHPGGVGELSHVGNHARH